MLALTGPTSVWFVGNFFIVFILSRKEKPKFPQAIIEPAGRKKTMKKFPAPFQMEHTILSGGYFIISTIC